MDAHIFRAALWCDTCIADVKKDLVLNKGWSRDWEAATYTAPDGTAFQESGYLVDVNGTDTDRFPNGPHGDGGGEADCPQACDGCGVFLENPLTEDGYTFVESAVLDALRNGEKKSVAVDEWLPFYRGDFGFFDDWSIRDVLDAALEGIEHLNDEVNELRGDA